MLCWTGTTAGWSKSWRRFHRSRRWAGLARRGTTSCGPTATSTRRRSSCVSAARDRPGGRHDLGKGNFVECKAVVASIAKVEASPSLQQMGDSSVLDPIEEEAEQQEDIKVQRAKVVMDTLLELIGLREAGHFGEGEEFFEELYAERAQWSAVCQALGVEFEDYPSSGARGVLPGAGSSPSLPSGLERKQAAPSRGTWP
ncbi:unnamed protein product [Prorocentrum cordatum]|uniref:Uncharacterized protein n=1 Tax=Prorocentrum cordatum TaxID=2364126 RepID=A0ABN9T4A0_9DINO|nr:unnamed protein product [Polarella glacialis]